MDTAFDKTKFQPVKANPVKIDLAKYNNLKSKFGKFLDDYDKRKIEAVEGLKRGYGIPKLHKKDNPLRPIMSSIASITGGAEEYLRDLISPILDKCVFNVNSAKTFKERFILTHH